VHPGAGAAGVRQRRFLIVYRQAMISLAGLASDPANLLFRCGVLLPAWAACR
jgi:hypothetical protein